MDPGPARNEIARKDNRTLGPRHLGEQEIELELTPKAMDQLAEDGYDPEFGARPLKRAIQKHVQNALADAILSGQLTRGSLGRIDHDGTGFQLEIIARETSSV